MLVELRDHRISGHRLNRVLQLFHDRDCASHWHINFDPQVFKQLKFFFFCLACFEKADECFLFGDFGHIAKDFREKVVRILTATLIPFLIIFLFCAENRLQAEETLAQIDIHRPLYFFLFEGKIGV